MRSVEAASRDDAIAAAREQFGPQARVVGVRRVRSGGVLGFFATERYVAEVAELALETAARPSSFGDDELPADFSSPLASAAPARARAAAPARNGAAAWAAAAAPRSADDIPEEVLAAAAAARAARSAGRPAEPAPARNASSSPAPSRPADEERVSELVGLLSAQRAEPAAASYSRTSPQRAAFPRAAAVSRSGGSLVDDEQTEAPVRGGGQSVLPASAPTAPSPFTAALARMVAGDQDVRQAVQEALAKPETLTQPDTAETRDAEPWPARSEPTRSAETSVPPSPARQEEETVGDLVMAPPSTTDPAVEMPTWAAEPEVPTSSTSQREEAIADLLRGALAQGHSDEALAGILRKVLAGASPQTALAEPVFAVPTLPVPPLDLAPVVEPVHEEPVNEEPVSEVSVMDRPFTEELSTRVVVPRTVAPVAPAADAVEEIPAVVESAPAEVFPAPPPVVLSASPTSMWGAPAPSSLWGEATPAATRTDDAAVPAAVAQAPVETPLFPATVPAEPVVEAVVAAPVVEVPEVEVPVVEAAVIEEAATEIEVEDAIEEAVEEAEVAELAPVLARTASDPAPMMSTDATTVMPPLSLLPPLPSSRGRGRPPVPPAAPRAAAPRPSAPSTGSADPHAPAATGAPEDDRRLATVTRLPVAPLMAGPDVPELPEDFDQLCAEELLAAPEPTPMFAAAGTGDTAAPVQVASGDVADRLVQLGLPAELLGSTFRADVAELGTYAALTRSLALQLPKAPELPRGAGEAVFVVGPGADALRAARSLAASLHLDPDCVQWATRGDLAGLAPRSSRITSVDVAVDRRQESVVDGTVTIVAVDAPLRADAYWMAQMVGVWAPVAVWAVVEATRKPEDLESWLDGLHRVDALIVQDADLSADPAAVLRRVDAPVAVIDGARATPHRWASLLCERLESTTT
ncbi:MAG TPA: hypothetical protein VFG13_05335 [Blastococcus sp.]|nr:hypothetical protein [Blastococcus sp.]